MSVISSWYGAVKGWCQEQKLFLFGTLVTSVLLQLHMSSFHPDPHLDRAMNAVTIVMTPQGMGTGFFVTADGCMLTAAHVVMDEKTGKYVPVKFMIHGETSMHDGIVVHASGYEDIAYVCSKDNINPEYLRIVNTEGIKRGDTEYALGHTYGRVWNLTQGIVSRMGYFGHGVIGKKDGVTERYNLWITSFISWGNSGGPIIDSHGDVIGMLTEFDDVSHLGGPTGEGIATTGTDLLRYLRTLHGG